jgi:hypothetical protein
MKNINYEGPHYAAFVHTVCKNYMLALSTETVLM